MITNFNEKYKRKRCFIWKRKGAMNECVRVFVYVCVCPRTNQHGNILKNGCTMYVHNSKRDEEKEREREKILENNSCSMAKEMGRQ